MRCPGTGHVGVDHCTLIAVRASDQPHRETDVSRAWPRADGSTCALGAAPRVFRAEGTSESLGALSGKRVPLECGQGSGL